MLYRKKIKTGDDFTGKYVGGRKVAMAATDNEKTMLIAYHNSILALEALIKDLIGHTVDLRERETDLDFFIASKAGLR